MSSTNHTQHYGLSQWEPEDAFLREDFNEDFRKIDEAIHTQAVVTGTYLGTYQNQSTWMQDISLGFRPKAVLVLPNKLNFASGENRGLTGLALDGADNETLIITDDGFRVTGALNQRDSPSESYARNPYRYIAWR